jgi:RimJ/RimL family protein N-acetyltransferase
VDWSSQTWQFDTERLRIVPWRQGGDDRLAAFLCAELTCDVTRELPPTWQAGVQAEAAPDWIAAREGEGQMFAVESKADGVLVGLFMFFPGSASRHRGEVRLGYVLAQTAWGRGYATEIVEGFLRRWDGEGITANLLAGVTSQNTASQRVLEKCGFVRAGESDGILEYRRRVE